MDIVDHTHVTHLQYSYKHHLAVPHIPMSQTGKENVALHNTHWQTHGLQTIRYVQQEKANDKLLMVSILSSHCWRSYSSITEKNHYKTTWRTQNLLGSEMRKLMQYRHIRNFHNPRQRRLQLPSPASEQSTCTHTCLETGIAFNLYHGLQRTAGEKCNRCPMVYLVCSSSLCSRAESACLDRAYLG